MKNFVAHILMAFFTSALLVIGGMHMAQGNPLFLFDLAGSSIFLMVLTLPTEDENK